jgi:hypothetical protein
MRVSIVNCVSTARDMMAFSDRSLVSHAGDTNWDYIVVKWLPSPAVEDYLERLPDIVRSLQPIEGIQVHVIEHVTDESVGYVPNLRAMMNEGFDYGFSLNDFTGLVNTDMYFGPDWLKHLKQYAIPRRVINSQHITKATAPKPVRGIITEDLGMPLDGQFNSQRFINLYNELFENEMWMAPSDDHRQAATMPYLFHKRYWDQCGPWELTLEKGTPDMRFFQRVADAGAEFALALGSICFHAEAVERRGPRPKGAEDMKEE